MQIKVSVERVRCPVCGNKTRDKIREDTVLKNFPLFCSKCKRECLINIEQFHITVIKAPDAQPWLFLLEGRSGGNPFLNVLPQRIVGDGSGVTTRI